MADTLPGVGASRTSSTGRGIDGTGRRRSPVRAPEAVAGRAAPSMEPPQKHYVHVEGRRFDLSAPRGTYLNVLI
jgi:hypothetical protein